MAGKSIVIGVVSVSPLFAAGLTSILRSRPSVHGATVVEMPAATLLKTAADRRPDIIVADQWSLDREMIAALRSEIGNLRIMVVAATHLPETTRQLYDAAAEIFDSPDKIAAMLTKCLPQMKENDRKELSPREKDVIIGVVKGLSNKEIADRLNVSTHTVMTHRRNIASKLQIHSPAGLTIYAIVSRLVSLEEVSASI